MESMIERVARAICTANGGDPDSDDHRQPTWRDYVPEARAAIEAMREPSRVMIKAGRKSPDVRGGTSDCDVSPFPNNTITRYQAMIDAALAS